MDAGSAQSSRQGSKKQAGGPRLFLAFESVPYRWLWGSMFFSSMAMAVRMLAQGWLVLELTNSPFWVGMVSGVQGIATVAFGAPAGALVDRLDRRRVVIWVQAASGAVTLAIGLLAVFDRVELWHLLVASLASGAVHAVQMPASNAMVYDVVGPRRLLNAMAARMIAFNITRIAGSLIAGGLMMWLGIGSSFLFAGAVAFCGVACALPIKGRFLADGKTDPFWPSVRQGISFVWRRKDIRKLLFMSFLMETFGFSHAIMLPVMARDVLGVGAGGLGVLSAAGGVGAMVSNVGVAALGDYKAKTKLLAGTSLAAGASLVLFALSPWYAGSVVLVAVVGAALMAYDVTMNTVLQLLITDEVRGRVMGLYGLTFGFTPIGGFLSGSMASVASAPFALGLGGVVIVAFVAIVVRSLASKDERPAPKA